MSVAGLDGLFGVREYFTISSDFDEMNKVSDGYSQTEGG